MTIVINGMKITEATTFQYKSNPKRAGSKAYGRYSVYEAATNLAEYNSLCEDFSKYAKADLRYDTEKGHLTLFGEDDVALIPSTTEILAMPLAAAQANAKAANDALAKAEADESERLIEAAEAEQLAEAQAEDAPTEAEEAEMDALDAEEKEAEEAEAEELESEEFDPEGPGTDEIYMDDEEEAEAAELEEADRDEDETF